MQRDEALGVAAPDTNNWKPAVHCSPHQPMSSIRDVQPVGNEPLDDETGELRRFQDVPNHRDEVDLCLWAPVPSSSQ